ncbi:LON peptidase N-terminal domain and RING finger protein 1 [Cylas formicarius]|uniref:LON peptidase N-terminal domain and RING finger protein 1 n=1 Tax=Cylas formicarius TaxID=197179 RepID=UPI00295879B3|nr:LON peptidase N-terminal domain and RING finger protein 1 [Cylas formicarius]
MMRRSDSTTTELKCNGRSLRRSSEKIKRLKRREKRPYGRPKLFSGGDLFSCPLCGNLLKHPVTVGCGHTFCSGCLRSDCGIRCSKCSTSFLGNKQKPHCVNVVVQHLVEKWRDKPDDDNDTGAPPKTRWTTCITPDDLECILCSLCFLDPVTTSCGHTFCRDCLTRVLDHRLTCPLCTHPLEVGDYFKRTTLLLDDAVRILIPEEFDDRLKVTLSERFELAASPDVPVFVCTNAFPGVACPLYVNEPRYRLLTRRCLQSSSKRFAMASGDPNNKFTDYGTVLEVKDAVTLADGRTILTTVGVQRFKVLSRGEQDGYDTAKVDYIRDAQVPPEKVAHLTGLHQKVHSKAVKLIRSLKPNVLAEVEQLIGEMPKIEKHWAALPDGPCWTWWLIPILPLSPQLQVGLISTTSLEKRLRAIDKMLEHMKIKMKALQRDTVTCSHPDDSLGICREGRADIEADSVEN